MKIVTPEKTSVEKISLSDVEASQNLFVVNAWRHWCGIHEMPPAAKLSPRDLGGALANISITRYLPELDDYRFAIIGDAHVQAYGTNHQGRLMSDVVALVPRFGRQLKSSYDLVRTTRRPFALRGAIGRDIPDCRFVWFETVYLPLGSAETGVECILNTAAYAPRKGIDWEIPRQRSFGRADAAGF